MEFDDLALETAMRLGYTAEFGSEEHDQILSLEQPLAERYYFREFLHRTPELRKYLCLTSLPYLFLERSLSDEMRAVWEQRLRRVWPLSWSGGTSVSGIQYRAVMPTGNLMPKYMFVFETPVILPKYRDKFDRMLTRGTFAQRFRKALYSLGILDECWFTSIIKTAVVNRWHREITDLDVKQQGHWLRNEINILQPEVVISVGTNAERRMPCEYHVSIQSWRQLKEDAIDDYASHIKGRLHL